MRHVRIPINEVQRILDETRLLELPVILRVKVVLGLYEFVSHVDQSGLADLQIANDPRNILVSFNNFLNILVQRSVLCNNQLFYWVSVIFEERN